MSDLIPEARIIVRLKDRIRELEAALQAIATNKLASSTVVGPLYHAGISAGLGIAADMARKALKPTGHHPRDAEMQAWIEMQINVYGVPRQEAEKQAADRRRAGGDQGE